FSGRDDTAFLWGIAQQEARAAKFLTAEEAVEEMTLQPGFAANVFAAEPMISQPMAFCWDDRGRLWIAENRDYESRGGGFSNSGDSRIVILEDADRDGAADRRTVFLEGIPFPAAIAVGFGGLWLGAPPNLLFVPDADGDDLADVDDVEVRLTGWGIRDRHETINSFHWGPDGWLYGCQGFATPSRVGKPLGKGRIYKPGEPFPQALRFADEPIDINGGVWRYHPTKRRFEVVAHGFSNPWGIDYDAKGQLFITACVIPHLWHVIPGGIYHRQGGKHFNPYVYRDIRTIADHRHRSAHGGARIYLSDAFPDTYHGRIMMANIHEHAVLTDALEPAGSGFVGRHGDELLLANNAQWIGFSVEIGPEGALYILDWHDADICGKEVLNKETGRVFRIKPTRSQANEFPNRFADLSKLPDLRLVELQRSASAWHARRARLILQARATEGNLDVDVRPALRDLFLHDENVDHKLRALWTLHAVGGVDPRDLLAALDDEDAYVRGWAIQLLCEDRDPSAAALDRFVAMAGRDDSPVVRLYLAACLQRIPDAARWELAEQLVARGEDINDHNIPKMLWFGVEPLVPQDPSRALRIASASELPIITRFIARRLAEADEWEAVIDAVAATDRGRRELLEGLLDGLEGADDAAPPQNWSTVYKLLRSDDDLSTLVTALAQQFGDAEAAETLFRTVADRQANPAARRQALRGLAGRGHAQTPQLIVELLEESALRHDAIRAAASFDDATLAEELLIRYRHYGPETKLEIVHALASRSSYGRMLTSAIEAGDVARRDVPAYVARQLRRVVGNRFVDAWGPIDALPEDKQQALAKYRELLQAEAVAAADASAGGRVFHRTCGPCHRIHGRGGLVGPDLTGANRGNLEYLLGNILTPSAEIQDDYKMTLVLTDEGRALAGTVAGESDRQLRLRVAGEDEPVTIPKSQIESREISNVSMMPERLLENLSDQEVIDLTAFLGADLQGRETVSE
ncbi:MAG: PVC-type heme-binding CxxCH protein, partial [Planctomycetota bacterium]